MSGEQEVRARHSKCVTVSHEPDHATWWWDVHAMVLCTHPEWHQEAIAAMSPLDYWRDVLAQRERQVAWAESVLCEARDDAAHALRMIEALQAS